MRNAVFIIPKPALLVEAVKTIDDIFEVMERDSRYNGQAFQDIQGDVYEMLLSEIASAGKNGQFRTPRHIIKLMADMVQPQLGHKIADPACGSGGFLLGAYQYIVTQLASKAGSKANGQYWIGGNTRSSSHQPLQILIRPHHLYLAQCVAVRQMTHHLYRLGLGLFAGKPQQCAMGFGV
jgi:hypothetical protein